MSQRRTGSRLAHGGVQYLLSTDPGAATYQDKSTVGTNLAMRCWTDRQTTNTSGQITFTIPAGFFTTIYNVNAQIVYPTTGGFGGFCQITTLTTTSVTVQTLENNTSSVLIGGLVNGLKYGTTAVPIHLMAVGV